MNKEDLIRRWMAKAEEDLEMCRVALEHRPDLVEAICFHAQQAAEKSIKALLVEYDISFRKVHSLVYLLDLVADRLKDAEKLYNGWFCERPSPEGAFYFQPMALGIWSWGTYPSPNGAA